MSNIVKKEIDGVVYRARFKGMAFALDLMEKVQEDDSQLKLAKLLFEEVLVSPKVSIDDFSDIPSFLKVQSFLFDVARGITSNREPTKAQVKRKVKENWALWKLVLSNRGFDYPTVFGKSCMTQQDIIEANIALDMQLDAEKKAAQRKH